MIVFGIGPAGTGKTYLAMAMAIEAFKRDEVNKNNSYKTCDRGSRRKLGFLPGGPSK